MVNTFDVIFLTAQTVLLILFTIQIKRNRTSAHYLVIAMIFGILAVSFSIFRSLPLSSITNRLILAMQLIFYGFEYFMVYLHFRGTISDKMDLYQVFSLAFIYGIHSAFGIFYIMSGINGVAEFMWDISYDLLGLGVFVYVSYCLYLAYNQTREKSAAIQAAASLMMAFGFFVSIFQTPIFRGLLGFEISGIVIGGVKSIGLLLILLVYVINPDYIERLPIQTYGIMAFDKGGNNISFHQIKSRGVFQDISHGSEASLISALTRAALSFIKDALGSKNDLNRITADDKLILFNIGENVGVAVIAERSTTILLDSIARCQSRLDKQIGDEIQRGRVDKKRIKNIIADSFPYISFVS